MELTRRTALTGMACIPAWLLAGCQRIGRLPFTGRIVGPNVQLGHALRDQRHGKRAAALHQDTDVVIIGGGVAGLTAAWRLQQQGIEDYVLLELEAAAGGTSRAGANSFIRFPWGAHYLPLPQRDNGELVDLLQEMGVLEGVDAEGQPIAREEYLCRDPEERVFVAGAWHEGLYPYAGASQQDLAELDAFQREVSRWAAWLDADGRRAFALPLAASSQDEQVWQLDQLSMAEWMDEQRWHSPRLRWLVDYSCRDDYGLTLSQTSAWAGLFYFAARQRPGSSESQPLLTWPEGNARFTDYLANKVRDKLRVGWAAAWVQPAEEARRDTHSRWRVTAINAADTARTIEYRAKAVVFAAPQFLAPYIVEGLRDDAIGDRSRWSYGSWLVANLTLDSRLAEPGFPLAWDNVLYDSPSLGYVVATHQRGVDYGPTVLTYYYAFCHEDPQQARRELLAMDWEACARLVITDLEQAHPDLRSRVQRLDVMRWGHAMIQPRPGFLTSPARQRAQQPWRGLHFAHTDLSGIALLEEAFYHGSRAARNVAAALQAVT